MAAYSSATSTLTAEGTILTVTAALAVAVKAVDTTSTYETQIVLLPNGLFQGVITIAVV